MRDMTEQSAERFERSKLRAFYEDVIRRQLERDGASSSHLERHAAAVEHLERFVKRPLSPDEVDEELLNKFDSYLWRQGTSDGRRRDLIESLQRICRAYHPGPSVHGKRSQRRPLPDPAPGTLRHFYETIDIPRRLIGRTPRYINENRKTFWRLYEHFGRDILLSEQTDQLAADHFRWLLDQGLKAATINSGHMAVWFATWRYAHELKLVDRLPTIRKLPTTLETPDSWTVAEMQAIFAAARAAERKPIAGIPAGAWWEALLRVLWYTALRRRALMGLCRADVDLRSGWLSVPARLMKNGRGQTFRLGSDAIEAVARIWQPERKLLFPLAYDNTWFYDQFRMIVTTAGVSRGSYALSALHKIRRSVATTIAGHQGIGAAQTILGHSSQKITQRYLDPKRLPGADFSGVLGVIKDEPPAAAAG